MAFVQEKMVIRNPKIGDRVRVLSNAGEPRRSGYSKLIGVAGPKAFWAFYSGNSGTIRAVTRRYSSTILEVEPDPGQGYGLFYHFPSEIERIEEEANAG